MDASNVIDVGFDFREDTPPRKDPDASSPTLRLYHKLLWSKPLPNGRVLELNDTTSGEYLHHKSDLGEFHLASDAMVASFRYLPMVKAEPEQLAEFMHVGYTMGGMMLWPGNQIDGKWTINQERGCNRKRIRRVWCLRAGYIDAKLTRSLDEMVHHDRVFTPGVDIALVRAASTVGVFESGRKPDLTEPTHPCSGVPNRRFCRCSPCVCIVSA